MLLELGVDGFRFDAAKHMAPSDVQRYIDYVNARSGNGTWNYLEVITNGDTPPELYSGIAAITDFELYYAMHDVFSRPGGDMRSLRVPRAVADPRSVRFGENHDNLKEINPQYAITPYAQRADSFLATAYVLAREEGTPLVLNWDNTDCAYIPVGVRFRKTMFDRGADGKDVKENILSVIDRPDILTIERGAEGWVILNGGFAKLDIPQLDMTLTKLEGCYRELRNDFTVAIERRPDGKKYITRWGTGQRGGVEVQARDALFFERVGWERC
jgi:alpha-amylase